MLAKPIGSICDIACHSCFYLEKRELYPGNERFRMPDDVIDGNLGRMVEQSVACGFGPHKEKTLPRHCRECEVPYVEERPMGQLIKRTGHWMLSLTLLAALSAGCRVQQDGDRREQRRDD